MLDIYNYGGRRPLGLRHVTAYTRKGKRIYAPCSYDCTPRKATISKTPLFLAAGRGGMFHGSINNRRATAHNPWIWFVKEKASQTGKPFPQVLTNPQTRADYYNSQLKADFDEFREQRNPELYAPKKNLSTKKVRFAPKKTLTVKKKTQPESEEDYYEPNPDLSQFILPYEEESKPKPKKRKSSTRKKQPSSPRKKK